MKHFAVLALLLLQDPNPRDEKVLGRWKGMRAEEPIEFEVFKDKTAKVWREGKATAVTFRWTDATHVRVEREGESVGEASVDVKEGELTLTQNDGRSLKFRRPPALNTAAPKIETPREFFKVRKETAAKGDVGGVWSMTSRRYRDKMTDHVKDMGRLPRRDLQEMGFARPAEAIEPVELAFAFYELLYKFLGDDWTLDEVREDGEKATLTIAGKISGQAARRNLSLLRLDGTWAEDWSDELDAAMKRAVLNAKKTACANNLSQLWKMQYNYRAQFGGGEKQFCKEAGGGFWLALSRTEPPLIDMSLATLDDNLYACPFRREKYKAKTTDYRGPVDDINKNLGDDVIVGACLECHPDGSGTILLGSGEIQTVAKSDPLYAQALKETKP